MATAHRLSPLTLHVALRLSLLWTSMMFCYLYGDYFELYQPGKLESMLAGRMAIGAVTQGMLVGTSLLMAVPSLMIMLSPLLPPRVSRWANIVLGTAYAVIMAMAIRGTWAYYMLLGVVEIGIAASIVWSAWTWPTVEDAH